MLHTSFIKVNSAATDIKVGALTELKSLANPPSGVKAVCETINMIFGQKAGWQHSKKMLANPNKFLDMVKGYDYDRVSAATFKKLKKYATDPNETFDAIVRKSMAAGCLYKWVSALYNYCEVKFEIHGLPSKADAAEEIKSHSPRGAAEQEGGCAT